MELGVIGFYPSRNGQIKDGADFCFAANMKAPESREALPARAGLPTRTTRDSRFASSSAVSRSSPSKEPPKCLAQGDSWQSDAESWRGLVSRYSEHSERVKTPG